MYVHVDDYEAIFAGTSNVLSNTSTNIQCTTSDGVSTLTIQILPQGNGTAMVTIMDTNTPLFTRPQTFQVNPAN